MPTITDNGDNGKITLGGDDASDIAILVELNNTEKARIQLDGQAEFTSIVGADSSLGITGDAPATVTSAGGAVAITGGIGGATSGAGGAVSVTGGAATAGNSNGGAVSRTGGAGQGTGNGGAATTTGGASGAGATGTGGAASVTGGASLATNGSGGAGSLVGGAATGGTEGAVQVQGVSTGKLGFYGVTPITRAVLATGAGATADNIITALQNLGLVKQS